jgi:hypothetical protein
VKATSAQAAAARGARGHEPNFPEAFRLHPPREPEEMNALYAY